MPKRIERKAITHSGAPAETVSQHELNQKPGFFDFTRQVGKSAASRGPLFWACLCFGILILLIAITALVLFLMFYVGVPQVQIKGIDVPKTNETTNINVDLGEPNKRPPSLGFQIYVNVAIQNPNKLDLAFDRIDITAQHPRIPDLTIGRSVLTDIVLPKQGDLELKVLMNVKYSFKDDPLGNIPTDLLDSCSIAPGNSAPIKQLQLNLALDAKMKITEVIKIQLPTITSQPQFTCPQTFAQQVTISGQNYDLRSLNFTMISQGKLGLSNLSKV